MNYTHRDGNRCQSAHSWWLDLKNCILTVHPFLFKLFVVEGSECVSVCAWVRSESSCVHSCFPEHVPVFANLLNALDVSPWSSLGLRAHLRSSIVMATLKLNFSGHLCLFQSPLPPIHLGNHVDFFVHFVGSCMHQCCERCVCRLHVCATRPPVHAGWGFLWVTLLVASQPLVFVLKAQ